MNKFIHGKYISEEKENLPPGYREGRFLHAKEPEKHRRLKLYLKLGALLGSIAASIGLLFLHPFFGIRVIDIHGLTRIPEHEVRDTVDGILSYKKWFLLPQNNFFLVDIQDLHGILSQKYPLRKLTITKNFPHTLDITIEEKTSRIIYDNGVQYSLMDEDGRISEILRIVDDNEWKEIKKTVTSTNALGEEISEEKLISRFHAPAYKKIISEVGEYPLVYDTREKPIGKATVVLQGNTVQSVIQWYDILKQNGTLPISYFQIDQELGDVTIKTSEGWFIKARLNEDIQKQFEALQYILKNKVQRPNVQYIDVRFPGRVFWL